MVLGAAFLVGQAFEYTHACSSLSGGLMGSTFLTPTGFHGAHVLAGLIFLGLIWARAGKGAYSAQHHVGVEASALHWHFVDAIWVVLFTILYLISGEGSRTATNSRALAPHMEPRRRQWKRESLYCWRPR